jgi:hypothetical protein
MKLVKLPPSSRLPNGLIALARASHPPEASTSQSAELPCMVELVEATRAWKPDRSLLRPDPLAADASGFERAADEQTMVGATNLNDPCLFRSEPPPALTREPHADDVEDDEASIEFVGSLANLNRDEAQPTMASAWGEEKTQLYRPQRSRLAPQESCEEFEADVAPGEARVGPAPPKVIIAPAVLADSAPDPARAEATKRKRRGRPRSDNKLGLSMCLLGALALAFSAAWRHPRTAPVTHGALARVAAVAANLLGR